jgi:hypothetical protein
MGIEHRSKFGLALNGYKFAFENAAPYFVAAPINIFVRDFVK